MYYVEVEVLEKTSSEVRIMSLKNMYILTGFCLFLSFKKDLQRFKTIINVTNKISIIATTKSLVVSSILATIF